MPCKKKFQVTLHSKTGKGWGPGALTINTHVSGMQLSLPVTMTAADSFERKISVCVRATSSCYSAELSEGRGNRHDMSFGISDDTGTISISHTGPGSYTFGSGSGCPGRNLMRMGRYALSQLKRRKLKGKKMIWNVSKRSRSLKITVLNGYCDPPKGTPNMKWSVFCFVFCFLLWNLLGNVHQG